MMLYRQDHIPVNTPHDRRPGGLMIPKYITIHNTGNPSSTAAEERAWLTNPDNENQASYQIVVDDTEAVECIPLNEPAWHAGDGNGPGNRRSLGIEICESGDYAKALDNAAGIVARLIQERGWSTDRLRRHFDWSGKICPRLMYSGGSWAEWKAFKNLVEYKLSASISKEAEDEMDKVLGYDDWAWIELDLWLGDAYNEGIITEWKWVQAARDRTLTYANLLLLKILIDERRRSPK